MSSVPVNLCPVYAPVLGAFGVAFALVFACNATLSFPLSFSLMLRLPPSSFFVGAGAAYGTAKAGLGIIQVGVMRPDLVMRSTLPVVMAGIVGLYGVITDVAIMLTRTLTTTNSWSSPFLLPISSYL